MGQHSSRPVERVLVFVVVRAEPECVSLRVFACIVAFFPCCCVLLHVVAFCCVTLRVFALCSVCRFAVQVRYKKSL